MPRVKTGDKNMYKKTSKKNARRQAGFTLVELMLVMVILATLAAIVVPKLSGRTEKARKTAAMADINNIKGMLNLYEVEVGHYPEPDDGLMALLENVEEDPNWGGPYLEQPPIDPWGQEYIYDYPGRYNVDGFDLYSVGADGDEGTEDDVVNWYVEEDAR